MSSTPLFDSIALRAERSTPASDQAVAVRATSVRAEAAPRPTPAPEPSRAAAPTAPTSPLSAPIRATDAVLVPAALVAAIDEIPARVTRAMVTEHAVRSDQLVLVEAVADAITRAIVDAVAVELERIARDGVVRA